MQLQPRRLPGRIDRKAAAYASEIARLRSTGYTYEAIREALADVGIELSTAALRRELARRNKALVGGRLVPDSESRPHLPECGQSATARRLVPPSSSAPAVATNSHEIAEAFFNAHPSNPLIPPKEAP